MKRRDTSWLALIFSLVAILMVGCATDDAVSDASNDSTDGSGADVDVADGVVDTSTDDENSDGLLLVKLELPGMT
jgi:hypothetical protein